MGVSWRMWREYAELTEHKITTDITQTVLDFKFNQLQKCMIIYLLHQSSYFLLCLGELLHFFLFPSVVQRYVLVELGQFCHLLCFGLRGCYYVLLILGTTQRLRGSFKDNQDICALSH